MLRAPLMSYMSAPNFSGVLRWSHRMPMDKI